MGLGSAFGHRDEGRARGRAGPWQSGSRRRRVTARIRAGERSKADCRLLGKSVRFRASGTMANRRLVLHTPGCRSHRRSGIPVSGTNPARRGMERRAVRGRRSGGCSRPTKCADGDQAALGPLPNTTFCRADTQTARAAASCAWINEAHRGAGARARLGVAPRGARRGTPVATEVAMRDMRPRSHRSVVIEGAGCARRFRVAARGDDQQGTALRKMLGAAASKAASWQSRSYRSITMCSVSRKTTRGARRPKPWCARDARVDVSTSGLNIVNSGA